MIACTHTYMYTYIICMFMYVHIIYMYTSVGPWVTSTEMNGLGFGGARWFARTRQLLTTTTI